MTYSVFSPIHVRFKSRNFYSATSSCCHLIYNGSQKYSNISTFLLLFTHILYRTFENFTTTVTCIATVLVTFETDLKMYTKITRRWSWNIFLSHCILASKLRNFIQCLTALQYFFSNVLQIIIYSFHQFVSFYSLTRSLTRRTKWINYFPIAYFAFFRTEYFTLLVFTIRE